MCSFAEFVLVLVV